MSQKLTAKKLKRLGVPKIYWAGLMVASILGFSALGLTKVKNFYQIQKLFPKSAVVESITDGDTFMIKSGQSVRLEGINAPPNLSSAKEYLEKNLPAGKKVYLEYDRYQDDKFARLLAWVWVDCESDSPKFLPADYMHKSQNESNVGLTDNPEGCKNGKLVNEELVRSHLAKIEVYKDRGKLKYEDRIKMILSKSSF